MQEMQIFLFTIAGFSGSMAPTGHRAAHIPHRVQLLVIWGTMPTLPDFLYGLLPGMEGVVKLRLCNFSAIRSAKVCNCL